MGWVERAVGSGRTWLDENPQDPFIADAAERGLKVVEKNSKEIEGLAKDTFKIFLSSVAIGDFDQAKIAWIEQASADELIYDMAKANETLIAATFKRAEAKATALRIAKEITLAGAKALLKVFF